MSTKFYIKQDDTNEPLQIVIKKRQAPVNGITPPDIYWLTSQSIQNVYFSMAKVPQLQEDGSTLYPDGTIHYTDGTILNPITNTDIYIASIHLLPGDILNADYSVLKPNGDIVYPTGLIKHLDLTYSIPNNSLLLPNGMIEFPANPSYPTGYIYNPNSTDRTNYYKVGNPTTNAPLPNAKIPLPDDTKLSSTQVLTLPRSTIFLPPATQIVSTTTVLFPAGTTQENSPTINRTNALILPQTISIHSNAYTVTFNSQDRTYTFPGGTTLVHPIDPVDPSYIQFPNLSQIIVPRSTFEYSPSVFIFPYGTSYISAQQKFIFPGETITLPLSATINNILSNISVVFPTNTVITQTLITDPVEVLLVEQNTLTNDGVTHLYDGSSITLNDNHTVLYNGYEIFPRGTQRNTFLTIIHPDGWVAIPASSYINYYPTQQHPDGLIIRPTDAAIVNNDGTFTKLDMSIVDANGNVIQTANTQIDLYTATPNPPFIPTNTQSQFIVINQSTATYQDIVYIVTGTQTGSATLLQYQWQTQDTAHQGLFSGEFTIVFVDGTKRTFPILKDDTLFVEILAHFSEV